MFMTGQFPAKLGTTWEITQETPGSMAELKQDRGRPSNRNDAIVVTNTRPTSWSGRMFDIGIYKLGRLLVTQPDVPVGSQVDFILQPRLYFGVVRNMRVGDTFTSLEITAALTEFDLSIYPNGITVTMREDPGYGRFVFTGSPM